MQNNPLELELCLQKDELSSENLKQLIKVNCVGNNQSLQFCQNQFCQSKNMFVCTQQECRCKDVHKKCEKSQISYALKKIKQKMAYSGLDQKIEEEFDKLIDQLSDMRDGLIENLRSFKTELALSKLQNIEKLFLHIVERNQDVQLLTNDSVKRLKKHLYQQQQGIPQQPIVQDLQQKFKKLQHSQRLDIESLKDDVEEMLINFQRKQNSWLFEVKLQQQIIDQLGQCGKQIQNSSIVTKVQSARNLVYFFAPQKVKSFELKYRASQHDFSLQSFFAQCGTQQDLMFLIRTQKGKVIGGYSPLFHQFQGHQIQGQGTRQLGGQFVEDNSKSSFIFSLSNNHVFQLRNPSRAIYRDKLKRFINFGASCGELRICDKANISNRSKTDINWGLKTSLNLNKNESSSYYNPNYKGGSGPNFFDKNSMLRINGNLDCHFQVDEWEAWKVVFQQK